MNNTILVCNTKVLTSSTKIYGTHALQQQAYEYNVIIFYVFCEPSNHIYSITKLPFHTANV